ncbi:fukutin-like [Mizuhopecten yessoensis]|uniref:fukutin-like n=1 Tax=Mizuhopecten yessoensis TaxID=6573 RepID=UPI000B45E2E6|nr:fukutin-like [Mizuhopecten yessoensis]
MWNGGMNTGNGKKAQTDDPNTSRVKEVIKALLDVWDNENAKLFLMDPDILIDYVEDKQGGHTCGRLCQSQKKLVTFGVIGNVHKKLSPVFHKLRIYNFNVVDFSEKISDGRGEKTYNITSQVLIQAMKQPEPAIHILILYECTAGFLWHAKKRIASSDPTFVYEAGLYTKFDLELAVIDGISLYIPKPANKFPGLVAQSKYIECNQTRKNDFLKAYPTNLSHKAKHFKKHAKEMIAEAKKVFDKLGMRFWISSGTLLGWYRQCDIIQYTTDVDFGMWIKDYNSQLIPEMKKSGLYLKHLYGRVNDSFELTFQDLHVKLDIFFFYEESDHMWNGGINKKNGAKYKYVFPKFGLCWTTLLDLFVRVPCPTLPYIEANYGKKWFTPVKKWSWKHSPSNVRKNGYWPKDQWDNVIQVYS